MHIQQVRYLYKEINSFSVGIYIFTSATFDKTTYYRKRDPVKFLNIHFSTVKLTQAAVQIQEGGGCSSSA